MNLTHSVENDELKTGYIQMRINVNNLTIYRGNCVLLKFVLSYSLYIFLENRLKETMFSSNKSNRIYCTYF